MAAQSGRKRFRIVLSWFVPFSGLSAAERPCMAQREARIIARHAVPAVALLFRHAHAGYKGRRVNYRITIGFVRSQSRAKSSSITKHNF